MDVLDPVQWSVHIYCFVGKLEDKSDRIVRSEGLVLCRCHARSINIFSEFIVLIFSKKEVHQNGQRFYKRIKSWTKNSLLGLHDSRYEICTLH